MAFLPDLFRPRHSPGGEKGGSGPADNQEGTERASLPPPAPATSSPPEVPGSQLVLLLDDVLSRVPTQSLKPGLHDPTQELHFAMEELLEGISRGRATVLLSRLAAHYPETFQAPATEAEDTAISLPLQKLIQQIGRSSRRPAERVVPPAASAKPAEPLVEERALESPAATMAAEPSPTTPPPAGRSPEAVPVVSSAHEGKVVTDSASAAAPPTRATGPEKSSAPLPAAERTQPNPEPLPTAPPQPLAAEKPVPKRSGLSKFSPFSPPASTPPAATVSTQVVEPPPLPAKPAAVSVGEASPLVAPAPSVKAPSTTAPTLPPRPAQPPTPVPTAAPAAPEHASPPAASPQTAPALSAEMVSPPPVRASAATLPPPTTPVAWPETQAETTLAAPGGGMRLAAGRPHVRPPSIQGPAGLVAPIEPQPAPAMPGFVFAPRPATAVAGPPPEPAPTVAPEIPIPPLFPLPHTPRPAEAPPEPPAASAPPPLFAAPPPTQAAPAPPAPPTSPIVEAPSPADLGEAILPELEHADPEVQGESVSAEADPDEEEERRLSPAARENVRTGEFYNKHFTLARIEQEPLQAIFMTEEFLDLPRVSELSCGFPGVSGCLIVAGDALAHGGERPAGLDAAALCRLTRQLTATAAEFPSELPAVQTFTLHAGNRALSIFSRPQVAMCIVHSHRGFLPGVRERLGAVADTLARGLGEEVEPS